MATPVQMILTVCSLLLLFQVVSAAPSRQRSTKGRKKSCQASLNTLRDLEDVVLRFANKHQVPVQVLIGEMGRDFAGHNRRTFRKQNKNKVSKGNGDILNEVASSEHTSAEVRPPMLTYHSEPPLPLVLPSDLSKQEKTGERGRKTISLAPPPFVTPEVLVRLTSETDDELPWDLTELAVVASPQMSVAECLHQAATLLDYQFPEMATNPFDIQFWYSPSLSCTIIKNCGEVYATPTHVWEIMVISAQHQVTYHGLCVPKVQEVAVYPGYIVQIRYVKINR